MFRARIFAASLLTALCTSGIATAGHPYWEANDSKTRYWEVTVYVAPDGRKWASAITRDYFNLQSRDVLLAVALDRKLVRLFRDIYLMGEIQIGQTLPDHYGTMFSGMLGIKLDNLFGIRRLSLAAYTGPSYDLNPANYVIGYNHRVYKNVLRKKFLNAVAAEISGPLPWGENWDWTGRLYHRSGVFGLYSHGDDDGLALGVGLKYHF